MALNRPHMCRAQLSVHKRSSLRCTTYRSSKFQHTSLLLEEITQPECISGDTPHLSSWIGLICESWNYLQSHNAGFCAIKQRQLFGVYSRSACGAVKRLTWITCTRW